MKKRALTIAIIFTLTAITLVTLVIAAKSNKVERNTFTRNIVQDKIRLVNTLKFNKRSYYLAGLSESCVYVGDRSKPDQILTYNIKTQDTSRLTIKNFPFDSLKNPFYEVIPPNIFISDLERFKLWVTDINSLNTPTIAVEKIFFADITPLGKRSAIIRTMKDSAREYCLAKVVDGKITIKKNILTKQIDGLFCTDGMLTYDDESATLNYLYYYRNQFISMDTNLNIKYKGNTLDSNSHAKLKISSIASQNAITMATPPYMVNKRSATEGELIYVNSNLLSQNEQEEPFNEGSVIDVYNTKLNSYLYSFYIPDLEKKKISSLKVRHKNLATIIDQSLVVFEFTEQPTSEIKLQ